MASIFGRGLSLLGWDYLRCDASLHLLVRRYLGPGRIDENLHSAPASIRTRLCNGGTYHFLFGMGPNLEIERLD